MMADTPVIPVTPVTRASMAGREIDNGIDLRERLSFVWRHWKFILSITVLACVVGVIYLLHVTPLYTATAQILIDQQKQNAPDGSKVFDNVNPDVAMLENQMAIIRSTAFLRRVVDNDHLVATASPAAPTAPQTDPPQNSLLSYLPVSVTSFFSQIVALIDGSPAVESDTPSPGVQVGADLLSADELNAVEGLRASLGVSHAPNTGNVIVISFTSPDAAAAAKLANDIANAFLVDKLDTRFEQAKRASAWLSDRLASLRQEVEDSEQAVTTFRAEHGLVQSGNVTLNQQQLSDLNAKLIDAKADLAQKKALVTQLDALASKGGSLQAMPDISNGGALPTLRQQAADLSAKEAELLAHYGPSHPLVVNLRAQIRDVDTSIAAETQRLAAAIRNQYALAQARVASLEASLQQATGQSNVDDQTAIRLRELERTAAVNKTLFEDFLKEAKITQEDATFKPQDIRVITPALKPTTPSSPHATRFMGVTLVVGLFMGIGGAVAREKLKSGFTTPTQVEDFLGLPLLASVNHLRRRALKTGSKGGAAPFDLPSAKPMSRYSEAISSLRSGIRMTDIDHPPKVVQVTSAAPREGKTTIALSLAASAAAAKLKVLLIDADLRHPAATRALGLEKETGLVDLLLDEAETTEVVRFHEQRGFWTLASGKTTQNPSDVLGSESMRRLVADFRTNFDLVVIDTPPVGPVIDPVVVSPLSDKVVMIVRWNSTARELVKQSVDQLGGHPRVAGAVFNMVNERQARKYGRHAYSYYHRARYYEHYYSA